VLEVSQRSVRRVLGKDQSIWRKRRAGRGQGRAGWSVNNMRVGRIRWREGF
jgi:hypothetical protein